LALLAHSFHDARKLVRQAEGVRLQLLNDQLRRNPCTLDGGSHEIGSVQGVAEPLTHGPTDGHAGRIREALEGGVHLGCNRDGQPYIFGGGGSHGALYTTLHQISNQYRST
jgi:hypothetical protein